MKLASLSFFGLALSALISGCAAQADAQDEELAGDGAQAMTASTQSTYLGNVVFESITVADPAMAAGQAATAPTALWPASCVTHAPDPQNPLIVHVTFTDCTGPFGLVHLNGEEIATFSVHANGSLHADLVGQGLNANGKDITQSASADITIDGATRHIAWQGHWAHQNQNGVSVDHTSDLTVDIDTAAGCVTMNGNASTAVSARGVETTLSDVRVCRNSGGEAACPTGTVTNTAKASKKSVTVSFDGSDSAEVTTPRGVTFDVPLVCPAADASST